MTGRGGFVTSTTLKIVGYEKTSNFKKRKGSARAARNLQVIRRGEPPTPKKDEK